MSPIPCSHCGNNFMRQTIDPEAPKLCNNCSLREEKRNPKKEGNMELDIVNILVKCPKHLYTDIEEVCINNGTTPSDYFLKLHYVERQKFSYREGSELRGPLGTSPVRDAYWKEEKPKLDLEENQLASISTTGMPDKFYSSKKNKGNKK